MIYLLLLVFIILTLYLMYNNAVLTFKEQYFKTLVKRLKHNFKPDTYEEVEKVMKCENIFKLLKIKK